MDSNVETVVEITSGGVPIKELPFPDVSVDAVKHFCKHQNMIFGHEIQQPDVEIVDHFYKTLKRMHGEIMLDEIKTAKIFESELSEIDTDTYLYKVSATFTLNEESEAIHLKKLAFWFKTDGNEPQLFFFDKDEVESSEDTENAERFYENFSYESVHSSRVLNAIMSLLNLDAKHLYAQTRRSKESIYPVKVEEVLHSGSKKEYVIKSFKHLCKIHSDERNRPLDHCLMQHTDNVQLLEWLKDGNISKDTFNTAQAHLDKYGSTVHICMFNFYPGTVKNNQGLIEDLMLEDITHDSSRSTITKSYLEGEVYE